jgi:hypothetical protein
MINSDKDLKKEIELFVETYRVKYETINSKLLEDFESDEITREELSIKIKENYQNNFIALKSKLSEIEIDQNYEESDPEVLISDIFPTLNDMVGPKKLRDFINDVESISDIDGYIFEDSQNIEDKIHQTISAFNDSIVMSDAIGSLIDRQISSEISGKSTEELAWIKAYQIILSKMPETEKQTELEYLAKAKNMSDLEKKIRVRMNAYQSSIGLHKPFGTYGFKPAAGGEADVHTILPDGSHLIIAANKLVDNQMEGTQTVRHPMELALKNIYGTTKTQSTEIFDEFCRKVIGVKTFNKKNLLKLDPFFKEIIADPAKFKELKDEFSKIHIHTFQTYTQPKYTEAELENISFFDGANLSSEIKESKLRQIQATIQFKANNINNKMVENRDGSAIGKQKSDAAGTSVDNRALTWAGVTSLIDSYLDSLISQDTDLGSHPVQAVIEKMTKGSLPQQAALATVLIDRVNSRSMECSLGPSQATSLLDFFTESKIGEGITSKSKFFSIDVNSMEDRLDSDVDQEDSKGKKAFSEWKLEKSVKRSGLLDELKKLQPEFDFEALKDKASLKKIITANNINGYDYIIEICNSIQANKKDSKTPKVLGRLKSFFKK